jgi:prephenate dehydratase
VPQTPVLPAVDVLGYLGPEGTFTHQAVGLLGHPVGRAVPGASVAAVLADVGAGRADAGLVPVENSVEGSVNTTVDALASGPELRVVAEVLLPVRFVLAAARGVRLSGVTRVLSHPHALAQCRGWLGGHLPSAELVEVASTAAAAAEVGNAAAAAEVGNAAAAAAAQAAGAGGKWTAAVCAPVAAELHGLSVLADGIGAPGPTAVTRFVLVARPGTDVGALPPPTGADRTSLVVFIADNHPGALLDVLEQFAARGVDLTRLESRPTGEAMGRYSFAIDCEGHLTDARVGEALSGLRRTCRAVRFLGSYPRADATAANVRPGTAEQDFTDAAAWLSGLRGG